MDASAKSKAKIEVDEYLIKQAEVAFENQPKSPSEMLERWAFLGQAAAEQLTQEEQLHLMSRSADVKLTVKPKR